MKRISAELQQLLNSGVTTMCLCWLVERADSVVMGFTEHDEDLEFDGVLYQSASGFSASTLEQSLGLSVDNQTFSGALSTQFISEEDINFGRYDNSIVTIFWVDWTNDQNRILMSKGILGEVKRSDTKFEAEFRSIADQLNQKTGRAYQKTCDTTLGDDRCAFKFKDFDNNILEVNVNDKIASAWDALRLFDEPEITNSLYPVVLLPWVKDGGLVGSNLQFQWPLSINHVMKFITIAFPASAPILQDIYNNPYSVYPGSRSSGLEIIGDVGAVVGNDEAGSYYAYVIDHYTKVPGDILYFRGRSRIYSLEGKKVAGPLKYGDISNWYLLRKGNDTPVSTFTVIPDTGVTSTQFIITGMSGVSTQASGTLDGMVKSSMLDVYPDDTNPPNSLAGYYDRVVAAGGEDYRPYLRTRANKNTIAENLTFTFTGPPVKRLVFGGVVATVTGSTVKTATVSGIVTATSASYWNTTQIAIAPSEPPPIYYSDGNEDGSGQQANVYFVPDGNEGTGSSGTWYYIQSVEGNEGFTQTAPRPVTLGTTVPNTSSKAVGRYQPVAGGNVVGYWCTYRVVFTLLDDTTVDGEITIARQTSGASPTLVSTNASYYTFAVNDGGPGHESDAPYSSWPDVPFYGKSNIGSAWAASVELQPQSALLKQLIPQGTVNIPDNYPDNMMGQVFGFPLDDTSAYRVYLYATTDARYYIGSPGWDPRENNQDLPSVLDYGQPSNNNKIGWNSEGWFQHSYNPSLGQKISELRKSFLRVWPLVTRYSDTAGLIDLATEDLNSALSLALNYFTSNSPPYTLMSDFLATASKADAIYAAINAVVVNMVNAANANASVYLEYDIGIAQRTHGVPVAVPRTVADYNAWINANAIANGTATFSTLPFLLVPTRRSNLDTLDCYIIFSRMLNRSGEPSFTPIVSPSSTMAQYAISVLDQFVIGPAANYSRAWTGPIRGRIQNLINPTDFVAKLFVISDAVYFIQTVNIDATGEFFFTTSGVGSKLISIRDRTTDVILNDIIPGIGVLRSYRVPVPVPHPTTIYDEAGAGIQGLTSVTFVINGGLTYTVSYAGFRASVSEATLSGSPFSVTMQFRRNTQITNGLYNFYKAILYDGSTEIARSNISSSGFVTFTGLTNWRPSVNLRLYSRVPVENDIVVAHALKDRNFVYDQGVAIIAACCLGQQDYAERWILGLLNCLYISNTDPFDKPGVRTSNPMLIGNVSFSVNRYSGIPPDDYIRTGATAWVGTALAFFLQKFPTTIYYQDVYDRLFALMDNLNEYYLITPDHPDYRKNGNGGSANNPNNYILIPPINGVTVNPVRSNIPTEFEDNRRNLYTGGLGAYVSLYEAYSGQYYIPWVAAEHNIDMYFLLYDCYKVSGDETWLRASQRLFEAVVDIFWDDTEGRLIQGCRSVSKDYWTALDQHSWGACMLIAGGQPEKARRAMSKWTSKFRWVLPFGQIGVNAAGYSPYLEAAGLKAGQFSLEDTSPVNGVNLYPDVGPDYPGAIRAVWPEGTFGVVLAQMALGQIKPAMKTYTDVTPLLGTYGYIYTTNPDAAYELQAWESVAGTGWAIIAAKPSSFWEVTAELRFTENVPIEKTGFFSYAGTITSISGRFITINGTSTAQGQPAYYPSAFFAGGLFRVRSGPVADWISEVKTHYTSGNSIVLELWNSVPNGLIAGEAFYVTAGCDKLAKTCFSKFNNFLNFQGFPFMPGNDTYGKYPNQGDPKMDGGSDNIGWEV